MLQYNRTCKNLLKTLNKNFEQPEFLAPILKVNNMQYLSSKTFNISKNESIIQNFLYSVTLINEPVLYLEFFTLCYQ